MAVKLEEKDGGKVLEVYLTGKLVKEDYEILVPAVENLVRQNGVIRLLVVMHDFRGWTAGAMWEDTKFAMRHFSDIARLAIVGETRWQHGLAVFCKPFTAATVRFFESAEVEAARKWVADNSGTTSPARRPVAPGKTEDA